MHMFTSWCRALCINKKKKRYLLPFVSISDFSKKESKANIMLSRHVDQLLLTCPVAASKESLPHMLLLLLWDLRNTQSQSEVYFCLISWLGFFCLPFQGLFDIVFILRFLSIKVCAWYTKSACFCALGSSFNGNWNVSRSRCVLDLFYILSWSMHLQQTPILII